MSDLMVNVHTYITDEATYAMMYSDQYVWFNDECTHICYWWHYIHHVLCQTTLSELTMNAHTYVTDQNVRYKDECTHICHC